METKTITIKEYYEMKAKADIFDEIIDKWFEKALKHNS